MKLHEANRAYQLSDSGEEGFDSSEMVIKTLTPEMKLTSEQIKMLEEMRNYPIVYEEDCPETTPEMAEAFRKAAKVRDARKRVKNG